MAKVFFLFLFCLMLGTPETNHARALQDQAGRTVTVPDEIRRIVSLAPSITEIVYQLDRQDLLKGATQYSDTPAEARLLPRVGSYVRIDVEKVVALRPDLCLAIRDGNPIQAIRRIESLNIPVYVVDPKSLDDIMDMITGLGELLNAEEKAAEITADMRRRIQDVRARVEKEPTRPGVFFQIDAAPIVSAGRDTFIHELITAAGGINLADDAGPGYPKFGWEDVLHYKPDVVIVASMAGGHSVESLKANWSRWEHLPAVRNDRIHVVDAGLVDRPTPRLVEGLETFVRIIHPQFFTNE